MALWQLPSSLYNNTKDKFLVQKQTFFFWGGAPHRSFLYKAFLKATVQFNYQSQIMSFDGFNAADQSTS